MKALLLFALLCLAFSLAVSIAIARMLAVRNREEHDAAEAMRRFGEASRNYVSVDAAGSPD